MGGLTLVPSPGIIRRPGGPPKVTEPTVSTATIRTGRCHSRKKRAQPIKRPAGPGPDEQHVELRELAGDRRRRAAVVRLPVLRIGVLIQPDVAVIGSAQRPDVVDPRTEQAADRIRLGDDMDLAAERLHQAPGRQVAPGVSDAQEPVALVRRDHAQRNAQIPRRGLHQDRPGRQDAIPLGSLDHLARGLQLDRPGEVEALTLEEQRVPERWLKIDVQLLLVETLGRRNDPRQPEFFFYIQLSLVVVAEVGEEAECAFADGPGSQTGEKGSVIGKGEP